MKATLLILSLLCFGFSESKLVKTKITDSITVSLPAELVAMQADDIAQRYPSVRAPLGAFTNADQNVDFSVNISATQWPDADVEVAKQFFKASIFNLYNKVEMLNEGIVTLNKKKFIFFEFNSRINGDKRKETSSEPILKYTYIQYLILPKQSLVFSFNCPRDISEDWKENAKAIMKSVKVK